MLELLVKDESVKSFTSKYASNSPAFVKDLSEAYQKIIKLGKKRDKSKRKIRNVSWKRNQK